MKTLDYNDVFSYDEDTGEETPLTKDEWMTSDWKDHAGEVLENIDDLLEKHGLEIIDLDTGGDFYMYTIRKRKKK